jgi:hypothetical protein
VASQGGHPKQNFRESIWKQKKIAAISLMTKRIIPDGRVSVQSAALYINGAFSGLVMVYREYFVMLASKVCPVMMWKPIIDEKGKHKSRQPSRFSHLDTYDFLIFTSHSLI